MSLMESMRSGRDSTAVQLVFGAVIVSFVAFGAGGGLSGAPEVATVNGEAIGAYEYENAVRFTEDASRRGRALTEDDREAIRERVLQDLIEQRALIQEARRLGLQISDAEVAEALIRQAEENPAYRFLLDDKGRFDLQAYQNFLRQQAITRADYEADLRERLLLQKLYTLMAVGVSVSDPLVRQSYVDENTKVDLRYVRILPSRFAAGFEPGDDEVAKYLAEHEAEVRARYDDDFARLYDVPETVDLRTIRLAVGSDDLGVAELKQRLVPVRAELEKGGDFVAAVRRWSEDPSVAKDGLVEDVKVDQLEDPVAAAVRALEPGQISDVVVTPRDVRIVRVEAREPARRIPFDEVKLDIARKLLRDAEGPARATAFAKDELLPAWTDAGAPPEALLSDHGLTAQSTGLVPVASDNPTSLFQPPAAMLEAARAAAAGTVLPEVYEADGVLWVGAVAAREEADMTAFESERAKYREQALLQRRGDFFDAWKDEVVARAKVVR